MAPVGVVNLKDDSTYSMVIKFERFYVEYVPENLSVQLPQVFSRHHGNDICFLVTLCDPAGNQHQVLVKRVNSRPYLSTGWNEMGARYSLHGGGIVRLVYIRPDMFFMKIKDRYSKEVKYPTHPRIFKLARDAIVNEKKDPGEQFLRSISRVPALYHTLSKKLTQQDANSEKLSLAADFLHMIMLFGVQKVSLVDSNGYAYRCEVHNNQDDTSLCCIYSGWSHFRHVKVLFAGTRIRLCLTSMEPTIILFEFRRCIGLDS